MRKSYLIKLLNSVDDDPEVVVAGRGYGPVAYIAEQAVADGVIFLLLAGDENEEVGIIYPDSPDYFKKGMKSRNQIEGKS